MRFKVGEKVKLIRKTNTTYGFQVGKAYRITRIMENGRMQINNNGIGGYVGEEDIEKAQFIKSDLKDGDIVTFRDGDKRIVQNEKVRNGDNWLPLEIYREDLTDKDNTTVYDIIKVERPTQYETVFERKEEILDEAEKRYLRDVIRPFRDRVESIVKFESTNSREFICIQLKDYHNIDFPYFKESTMYKGMKANRAYTLEELGL